MPPLLVPPLVPEPLSVEPASAGGNAIAPYAGVTPLVWPPPVLLDDDDEEVVSPDDDELDDVGVDSPPHAETAVADANTSAARVIA